MRSTRLSYLRCIAVALRPGSMRHSRRGKRQSHLRSPGFSPVRPPRRCSDCFAAGEEPSAGCWRIHLLGSSCCAIWRRVFAPGLHVVGRGALGNAATATANAFGVSAMTTCVDLRSRDAARSELTTGRPAARYSGSLTDSLLR